MKTFDHIGGDCYAFRVGRRVAALQQFDATAEDIEASIGCKIDVMSYGARIVGTLDQLQRMARILDVTHTMDSCSAEYRRASIRAAQSLLAAIHKTRQETP